MTAAFTIRFYFDYISSNAYLAWTQLPALAARYGAQVELVPTLFAGFLEAHGQLGPAEVPAKAMWTFRNNLRKAAVLGVPLNGPAFHPFNPLLALRASVVPGDAGARAAFVTALFDAVWVHGLHVSDPDVVARVATNVGLDGHAVVARAHAPEAKARLRRDTEGAIARGVFGVPSMEVNGEIFWGYDDFPYMELVLAGKDPVANRVDLRSTAAPPASARRRRFRDAPGS